jgi:hypothetical protein
MKQNRNLKLLLIFSVLTYTVVNAQVGLEKVGQSTMNFQLVSISPRASAMGEAFISVGQGAESIFFNPAGLTESDNRFDVKLYTTSWIGDIDYIAGAFAWNLGNYGSIGFSALSVDYGTIYRTSLVPKGDESLYPSGYIDLGTVSNVGAYSLGLTYSRAISTQFFIGGNLRLVGQNLGQNNLESGVKDNDATKLVFDLGVKYYTGLRSFRFGMAIRNFSSNVKRERIYEQLPILFIMGAAIDVFELISGEPGENQLLFAIDFLHPNNYSERMNLGVEYLLFGKFALRAGYQTNQDVASWSAGIGLNSEIAGKTVIFDYSYSNFDIFDGVNRLSVGFSF